ncbi:MAG: hypothetical protein FWB85_09920 [Chitinispirillia bacterium]|nr:hypothetical protein [Chitinispirillia bacterium]
MSRFAGSSKVGDRASRFFGMALRTAVLWSLILMVKTAMAQPQKATIGSFTDPRDGKTYRTTTLGGTKWMAQNLNYETRDSWCYDDDSVACGVLGRLYSYDAAIKACPAGWSLPDTADWSALALASGGGLLRDLAGINLKSMRMWPRARSSGTDNFGWAGLPGGIRDADGTFNEGSNSGHWWSVTKTAAGSAYMVSMHVDMGNMPYTSRPGTWGASVRCFEGISRATRQLINQGIEYSTKKKDADKALELLTNAVQLSPTAPDAFMMRGAIYFDEKKDYPKAIADFDAAIALVSTEHRLYMSLHSFKARAYIGNKEYKKAIDDLTMVLGHNKNDINTLYLRGKAYRLSGDNKSALADLNLALLHERNSSIVFLERGKVYSSLGDTKKALADLELAMKTSTSENEKDSIALVISMNGGNLNLFTDSRDGKRYRTVKIGGKTWMTQDLNFKSKTYNWDAAMTACPADWRVPTNNDWSVLINAIDNSEDKLKGMTGWNRSPSQLAWWSATESGKNKDQAFTQLIEGNVVPRQTKADKKTKTNPVRCVTDKELPPPPKPMQSSATEQQLQPSAADAAKVIGANSVGSFVLKQPIPKSVPGYDIKKNSYIDEHEGTSVTEYSIVQNGKNVMVINKEHDKDTDTVISITILSDEYSTKSGLKIGSTLENLVKTYPAHTIGACCNRPYFQFIVRDDARKKGINFNFDGMANYIGNNYPEGWDWQDYKPDEFKPGSKVTEIRIW